MTEPPATSRQLTVAAVPLSAARLVATTAVALVLSAGAIAAFVAWRSPTEPTWRGFAAGTGAMAVAAAASVVPIVLGARFGVTGLVGGFFAGSFVRAIVGGGLSLVAVWAAGFDATATLLTMAVHYLAVLAAETAVVGRLLWNRPV